MTPKNIVLVNPNWKKRERTIWTTFASVYPPLGILNIHTIAMLRSHRRTPQV
jgi:hypothetical protein